MYRFLLSILMVFVCHTMYGQTKGVILNMETGIPIKDVQIYTNTNVRTTTNYLGQFRIPYQYQFQSLTITHEKFVPVTFNQDELSDTIYLMPKFNTLSEVVVWGKRRMTFNSKKIAQDARNWYTPSSGVSFDFFSLFQKKQGLNRKQREKHDEIIKNY